MWIQQFTCTVTDGGREISWRGKDDLPAGSALIASPYDPEARYSRKRGSAWTGFKVHLSEICDHPNRPHLITHVVTTDATANDATVVDAIHDNLAHKGLKPAEHLLDSGYASAELLLTTPVTRGITVVAPVRPNSTPQQVKATGFGRSAFTINWQAQQATCPTGAVSRYWTVGLDNNRRVAIRIRFATTTCAPCTVRDQCTRSTQYGRQLTVRPQDQDALLERVRAEQNTDEWKARYAARAGVEGTIHQAVAVSGIRRTRYPRPGEDPPRPRPHRHRRQPHSTRCLVERHPTRTHTNISTRCPRTYCLNKLGNGVFPGTRRAPWTAPAECATICG
ncbi:transposase [Streptomyces sp. NPDC021056]|uniref:transposase n=1 Tax=Streptomyces sp. NPDC021056 TaxID=3155012 RepID=UPI0033ECC613